MMRGFEKQNRALVSRQLGNQQRSMFVPYFMGVNKWTLPYPPTVSKNELDKIRFFDTKSRQQWDYHGVDEIINNQSPFRKTSHRPIFNTGTRERNDTCNEPAYATMSNPKDYKRLWEYFDEYTKPGSDPKIEAIKAVCEQWDAKEFYYPGEAWQRNRPSFRSVPKEILNRQTWYHYYNSITKQHEIAATWRPRQFNPMWPPPGYRCPKLWTKREWVFGVEEPGLVVELERYWWYRNWMENNARHGPADYWLTIGLFFLFWYMGHIRNSCKFAMLQVQNNMWYPGRSCMRQSGEPKDPRTGSWWWQTPLETWPNQGEIWWIREIRYGYINYLQRRDETEKIDRALSGVSD